ncbi:hypothetical protein FISHEDRAFT_61614 [Fistulina hepatica ATCC 64428]|uniref:Uncharacterized protein n=1 Tax=Fistulina hepatica ATCC 64428 TaxID=1128425 RepID=A0A0D7A134_9AGAR|nr:hypothetical protein FISHEDRAFT_61614 [Fistulina hepatica ATCC 64428]
MNSAPELVLCSGPPKKIILHGTSAAFLDPQSTYRVCFFLSIGGYCREYSKGKRPIGVMLEDAWLSLPSESRQNGAGSVGGGKTSTSSPVDAKKKAPGPKAQASKMSDTAMIIAATWQRLKQQKRALSQGIRPSPAAADPEDFETIRSLRLPFRIFEQGSHEYTPDDFYAPQLDKLGQCTCLKESGVVIPDPADEMGSNEDDEDDETETGDDDGALNGDGDVASDSEGRHMFRGLRERRTPATTGQSLPPYLWASGETLALFYARSSEYWTQTSTRAAGEATKDDSTRN